MGAQSAAAYPPPFGTLSIVETPSTWQSLT